VGSSGKTKEALIGRVEVRPAETDLNAGKRPMWEINGRKLKKIQKLGQG